MEYIIHSTFHLLRYDFLMVFRDPEEMGKAGEEINTDDGSIFSPLTSLASGMASGMAAGVTALTVFSDDSLSGELTHSSSIFLLFFFSFLILSRSLMFFA